MSRFTLTPTPLAGVILIERKFLRDERGFFERMFCAEALKEAGWVKPIAQINHSYTKHKGTVRGMHFQNPPHAEMKLVSCLRGAIFDVAVDLRKDSPTYLHWHGEVLSAENARSLLIPEGFAHGFQALEEACEMVYLHSAAYSQESERGVNAFEDRIAINWPLPTTIMAHKDKNHPMLANDFKGINV
jgi:dTDP-4-dehydrorhamnose 3,5-epimerase